MNDWDDLSQEIEEASMAKGPRCTVAQMFDYIPEESHASVRSLIMDQNIQASSLQRVLMKRLGNKAPSRLALGRHRRGECLCDRED